MFDHPTIPALDDLESAANAIKYCLTPDPGHRYQAPQPRPGGDTVEKLRRLHDCVVGVRRYVESLQESRESARRSEARLTRERDYLLRRLTEIAPAISESSPASSQLRLLYGDEIASIPNLADFVPTHHHFMKNPTEMNHLTTNPSTDDVEIVSDVDVATPTPELFSTGTRPVTGQITWKYHNPLAGLLSDYRPPTPDEVWDRILHPKPQLQTSGCMTVPPDPLSELLVLVGALGLTKEREFALVGRLEHVRRIMESEYAAKKALESQLFSERDQATAVARQQEMKDLKKRLKSLKRAARHARNAGIADG